MKVTKEMKKVFALVDEMNEERKKRVRVPVYYKRHGQMIRRNYDDTVDTERYNLLFYKKEGGIRENRCFTCQNCGCKCDYFEIAWWLYEDHNEMICTDCEAIAFGDDI